MGGKIQLYATHFSLTTSPQSFQVVTWYHIVFTRNGNTITLYSSNIATGVLGGSYLDDAPGWIGLPRGFYRVVIP